MSTLYSAILNPSGPNFKNWMEVLGSNKVPLESPQLHHAQLGKEKNVEVYKLNLQAMTLAPTGEPAGADRAK